MKTHWHKITVQGKHLVRISNTQLIRGLVAKMKVTGEKRMKVKVIIDLILINFSFIINIILITMFFLVQRQTLIQMKRSMSSR